MNNKKARGCPDFHLEFPVNPSPCGELFTCFSLFCFNSADCDGVLNSSTCCHTTRTHTSHTYAEHHSGHHQLLIGVIISAMADLSMFLGCSIQLRIGN